MAEPLPSGPTGARRARSVEALVWAVAALLILASLAFASTDTALAAAVAAIFSSANFSLGRWSLHRLLTRTGPGRLAFGLLYASKFGLLSIALSLLSVRAKLSLGGLLLGFTVLPLSLYVLLAAALLAKKG